MTTLATYTLSFFGIALFAVILPFICAICKLLFQIIIWIILIVICGVVIFFFPWVLGVLFILFIVGILTRD
jgi:hypothetical protein